MNANPEDIQWYNQPFIRQKLDYSILERHVEFLESIRQVHNSAISIFDLAEMKHAYLSSNFEEMLGWDLNEACKPGNHYINQKMHPEDLEHLNHVSSLFFELMLRLKHKDSENLSSYKLILDYRIRGKDGNYVRVIEQHKLLERDGDGNIWLALSIMDISPDQDLQSRCRYRLVNSKTGELYHFPSSNSLAALSQREQEILQLLSKGLISKQIADQLYISVNTVNTHRQRIIEKLNVRNTAEAVQHALSIGLI